MVVIQDNGMLWNGMPRSWLYACTIHESREQGAVTYGPLDNGSQDTFDPAAKIVVSLPGGVLGLSVSACFPGGPLAYRQPA